MAIANLARTTDDVNQRHEMTNRIPPTPLFIFLSVPEAAQAMAISVRTVWRMIYAGQLETRRVGRRRLVPRTALEQFARRGVAKIPLDARAK